MSLSRRLALMCLTLAATCSGFTTIASSTCTQSGLASTSTNEGTSSCGVISSAGSLAQASSFGNLIVVNPALQVKVNQSTDLVNVLASPGSAVTSIDLFGVFTTPGPEVPGFFEIDLAGLTSGQTYTITVGKNSTTTITSNQLTLSSVIELGVPFVVQIQSTLSTSSSAPGEISQSLNIMDSINLYTSQSKTTQVPIMVSSAPEPGMGWLVGVGGLGLLGVRRFRRSLHSTATGIRITE
jgi:MYXO-CTERM domain-containing protein